MARGGARVGAGRKTGTSDKALRKFSVTEILNASGTGPQAMPLTFLLGVVNLPPDADVKLSERIQCAIAAAPYCHPRLASVEIKGNQDAPLQIQTDIGQALAKLAEFARQREIIDITPEGEILEPLTYEDLADADDEATPPSGNSA